MKMNANLCWIGKETEGNQRFSDVPYMAYLYQTNRWGRRVLRKFTLLELAFVIASMKVIDPKLMKVFKDLLKINHRIRMS